MSDAFLAGIEEAADNTRKASMDKIAYSERIRREYRRNLIEFTATSQIAGMFGDPVALSDAELCSKISGLQGVAQVVLDESAYPSQQRLAAHVVHKLVLDTIELKGKRAARP